MSSNTSSGEEIGSSDPAVGVYRPAPAPAVTPGAGTGTVRELGGRKDGTEPTRFGDWEKQGRCIDF